MLEIVVLSLIQGVTEFIPVSSSSHLIIISEFLKFTKENLLTNISLHIGSFIAVVIFFRNEINNFIKYKRIFFLILISSIPILGLGFFLVKLEIINYLRGIKIIGWTTLIFGILLFISDKFENTKKIENLNLKYSIIIGLFHTFSLIPGVSRSGIAITLGRFLGFSRVDAAKISFLLSIPVLFVVSLYGLYNLHVTESVDIKQINFIAITFSGFFSYVTIVFFLKFLKRFNLILFVIYRIILGSFLLYYAYL